MSSHSLPAAPAGSARRLCVQSRCLVRPVAPLGLPLVDASLLPRRWRMALLIGLRFGLWLSGERFRPTYLMRRARRAVECRRDACGRPQPPDARRFRCSPAVRSRICCPYRVFTWRWLEASSSSDPDFVAAMRAAGASSANSSGGCGRSDYRLHTLLRHFGRAGSTQRADVMALVGFGAKLFDRPALTLRSVAVAMTVVILLQPEAVVTPGFQMSFAAPSCANRALRILAPDRPARMAGDAVAGRRMDRRCGCNVHYRVARHDAARVASFQSRGGIQRGHQPCNVANHQFVDDARCRGNCCRRAFRSPGSVSGPPGKETPASCLRLPGTLRASRRISILPRLGAAAMLWAAIAIAAFCIFRASGRRLARAAGWVALADAVAGPSASGLHRHLWFSLCPDSQGLGCCQRLAPLQRAGAASDRR